jgi:hypothetical protein
MSAPVESGSQLSVQLQRLDILLHREILRLRARYQLSLDEFRGLYISDEQVAALIDQALGNESTTAAVDELTTRAEQMRGAGAARSGADLRWTRLATEFALSPVEQDILLLAVAPEIDLKYETLYAYLNNDVTRKWPTFDLALRLFSTTPTDQSVVRGCLFDESTLFSSGLLRRIQPTAPRSSWLTGGICAAPAVLSYLSGGSMAEPRFANLIERIRPATDWRQLPLSTGQRELLKRRFKLAMSGPAPLFLLTGREGSGRALSAEALCSDLGIGLLRVDVEEARGSGEPLIALIGSMLLQQRLQQAGVYLARCEALFDKDGAALPETHLALRNLTRGRAPIFLAFGSSGGQLSRPQATSWQDLFPRTRALALDFPDPDYATRLGLWSDAVARTGWSLASEDLDAIADRFVLTPRQIETAAEAAACTLGEDAATGELVPAALFEAARAQSDHSLGSLAVKVKTVHCWDDLILPRETLQRIKEVTAAIKLRHVVYSGWGFEDKIASGKGIKVLFSGASGTGKTMTASVMARDLELDLYKIDLSGVVSKYIGETEKNLDRIFRAAHSSNAILFFDEADALFGKRSEVKDAHDRYANIEVAYLLQKIEEYEGAVILASNLSRNIDDAFSRRMHYVVEFPLPDERSRERLWRGMFPARAPLSGDVDFGFIAKQFTISGGDIRNVVLDAAFLAAQDGQSITMRQIVIALSRQMMKQGKVPAPTDFKQYHTLIE